ncbi:MAG: LCP family protein [Brachybacterium sp.]|nr:LCP family protein [Brachybacterium sp.]MDN5688085.1 LCP family protein [Brachybacterium sp.]
MAADGTPAVPSAQGAADQEGAAGQQGADHRADGQGADDQGAARPGTAPATGASDRARSSTPASPPSPSGPSFSRPLRGNAPVHDAWSQEAASSEHDAWSDSLAPRSSSEPAAPGDGPTEPGSPAAVGAAAVGGPAAAVGPTAASGPPAGSRGSTPPRSAGSAGAASAGSAGSADTAAAATTDDGSLPKVAFWTVLTALLPGSGLITTHLRRIGWVLLAILALAAVTLTAFLVIGDPMRNGMMLLTNRSVLIAIMVTAVVVGLVWALQIVVANLAHSRQQHLEGSKRYIALALAALMVVAVAFPIGRSAQSLWAAQGLLGSTTVFGGRDGEGRTLAEGKDPWADTERVNVMLLGQDAGADRTGTRPDTIMMASVDTETGQTALFSIPRNLEKVEFPEGTPAAEEFPDGFDYYGPDQDLINAVWTWAEEHSDLFPDDPNPGLTATRWAVEETLGLDTDYYAMVNLQGFEDIVNAIGGVDLVVERRIPIGGGAGPIDGYIEPGSQKLDGYHALWYARSREGSNDFDRNCRQQRIVRAVAEEADPATLAMSVPRLVSATEANIQTDIPVSNLDAFVDLALRIKDGGFTSYPITPDVTPSGNPDYEYLESWVQASIEDSMKQDPPESVLGETEPGSTDPAETGAAPEEDGSSDDTADSEETTEEQTTEEETPTDEESSSAEETPTDGPEIDHDPLQSCLPGGDAQQG